MNLYLIRHPKPAVAAGVCYGQLDLALAEAVEPLAQRLRQQLPDQFSLFSSPLLRARLLAEALGQPSVVPALKEIDFGAWEGQTFAAIGEGLANWEKNPLGFAAPGGESPRQMAARVLRWWQICVAPLQNSDQTLVIVAHGGPLRVLLGHLLKIPMQQWIGLDFGCGQLTHLQLNAWGNVLKGFNQ
jgi:alpha-ribazole phosphatase